MCTPENTRKMSASHLFTETSGIIYVEPSKAFRLVRNQPQSLEAANPNDTLPSHMNRAPPGNHAVDRQTLQRLKRQAQFCKSISCITALHLTMETMCIQPNISKMILRMARCAYGLNLETDLRIALRSFLGKQGLRDPTRRAKLLGILPNGKKVVISGRCDALVTNDGGGVTPVEIKSRTRTDRFKSILKNGCMMDAFQSEWEGDDGQRHTSAGLGDATQSLLYMWLYGSKRLLYVQCARMGVNDPLVPLIAEISWSEKAFQKLKTSIMNRLRPIISSPASSDPPPSSVVVNDDTGTPPLTLHKKTTRGNKRKRYGGGGGGGEQKRKVYKTRLFSKCGALLTKAGIQNTTKIRTRRQNAALDHASRMLGSRKKLQYYYCNFHSVLHVGQLL